jgi:shikimate kinase
LNTLPQGINLYLIGMMGSGKTTVGKILATALKYRFFDTDVVIEQLAKQSISEIFADSGESVFRELETQVLAELSAYHRLAIATGGGIVLQRQNWSHLQQGLVIWIDLPVACICDRLQGDTSRPLLAQGDRLEKLTDLLEHRRPLYAQADLHISVQPEETPDQLAVRILETIPTVLKTVLKSDGRPTSPL